MTEKQKELLRRNASYWRDEGDKVEASENRKFLAEAIEAALGEAERGEKSRLGVLEWCQSRALSHRQEALELFAIINPPETPND